VVSERDTFDSAFVLGAGRDDLPELWTAESRCRAFLPGLRNPPGGGRSDPARGAKDSDGRLLRRREFYRIGRAPRSGIASPRHGALLRRDERGSCRRGQAFAGLARAGPQRLVPPLLSLLATLANWHTRVRPQPSPPRTSRYRFRSPRNPDRIDGSPLLTKPQHNGEVNEQADLRPPCRAFIAAAFDALREEPVTGPRPPRPRQLISVAEHADSEQGARSVVIVESVSRRGYRPAASPAAFAVIANPVSWRQHAGRVHALSYRRRARAS